MVNRADRVDMKLDLIAKEVKRQCMLYSGVVSMSGFSLTPWHFSIFTWKFNGELRIITCKCFVTCSYSIFKIRVMAIKKS